MTPPPCLTSRASPHGRPLAVGLRRVCSLIVTASVTALVVFHGYIFWKHLVSGSLADPERALSWAAGFAVLGLMVWLRRAGVPLFWGQKALAVWVVVALLHVGVPPSAGVIAETAGATANVALTLVILPSSVGWLTLLSCLLLAVAGMRRRTAAPALAGALLRRPRGPRPGPPPFRCSLASRAPPLPAC